MARSENKNKGRKEGKGERNEQLFSEEAVSVSYSLTPGSHTKYKHSRPESIKINQNINNITTSLFDPKLLIKF